MTQKEEVAKVSLNLDESPIRFIFEIAPAEEAVSILREEPEADKRRKESGVLDNPEVASILKSIGTSVFVCHAGT